MFRKQILIFLKMIDDKINEIDAQLKELPDGNLICCHNRRGYSWYRITPNNKEYISQFHRTKMCFAHPRDFNKLTRSTFLPRSRRLRSNNFLAARCA